MTIKLRQIILGISGFFLIPSFVAANFIDVPPHHESFKAITYLQEQGIVEGYSDGTFGPDLQINRAEFTKIIIKTLFPADAIFSCATSFSDVPPEFWFLPFVCKAEKEGILKGYPDGTFRGNNFVNFSEAAAILARAFNSDTIADGNPWYRPHIEYLTSQGAIPLSINSLTQAITRSQMAEMTYRLKAGITNKPSRTYDDLALEPAIHFEQREVQTARGTFRVDILTGDLSRDIRVVTDSAASETCARDCPVLSLSEYVQRNDAAAGIHGSYFCPPRLFLVCGQDQFFYLFHVCGFIPHFFKY